MKEEMGGMKMILVVFIFIILGTVFLSTIADSVFENTNTFPVTNETITTPTNQTASLLDHDDLSSVVTVTNSSTQKTTVVPASNYTVSLSAGSYIVNTALNTSMWNGTTVNISYIYFPEEYVQDGTSRTLLNLIGLFFAIGLLLYVIAKIMETYGYDIMSLGRGK